jgi:3-methylcrotonyl-CoA carboxylase alpha subunit
VHGPDRTAALRRLAAALGEYEVVGVQTNLPLLRGIVAHPEFAAARLDTGFLARHPDLLAPPGHEADAATVLAAAALAHLADQRAATGAEATASADPWSPWAQADAWRMNGDGYQDLALRTDGGAATVRVHPRADGRVRLDLPAGTVAAAAEEDASGMVLSLDGIRRRVRVVRRGADLTVVLDGRNHDVAVLDPLAPPAEEGGGDDRVTAPIPARVARVLVQPGDRVEKGAALVILEAMKMELTLTAPAAGVISTVRHGVDEMVDEGTELVTFEAG